MRIDADYHFELKAKYQKLLEFVKNVANLNFNDNPASHSKDAKELLKEIGER